MTTDKVEPISGEALTKKTVQGMSATAECLRNEGEDSLHMQFRNAVTLIEQQQSRLNAAEAETASIKADNEKLREALEFYADVKKWGGFADWAPTGEVFAAQLIHIRDHTISYFVRFGGAAIQPEHILSIREH